MLKLGNERQKKYCGLHQSLVRRYEVPFIVLAKIDKAAYKVKLPPTMKFHPVFHVSVLKPYHVNLVDPTREESHRAPPTVMTFFDKEVEEILFDRVIRQKLRKPSYEYLFRWKVLSDSETT